MVSGPSLFSGASSFDATVQNLLVVERLPLDRNREKQTSLKTRTAMFGDLKQLLTDLQGLTKNLAKTGTDSVFQAKTVTSSDKDIITATADASAVNSAYSIDITALAKTHRVASTKQADSTSALNLAGTIRINTQDIVIALTDTLLDVRDAINSATYADGDEVVASIVDNTLVLQTKDTGATKAVVASDQSGTVLQSLGVLDGVGAFVTELQTAQDAAFTVDGIAATSESNTGIDTAVSGVTLNFSATTTSTLTVTVAANKGSVTTKTKEFLAKLNEVVGYISTKTKTEASEQDGISTRGLLAGDTVFTFLRRNLISQIVEQVTGLTAGDPAHLSEIGITFEEGLVASITDVKAFDDALANDADKIGNLFNSANGIATKLEALLEPYTVTSGVVDDTVTALSDRMRTLQAQEQRINGRLAIREAQIRAQLTAMQGILAGLNAQQSFITSIFGITG